MNKDEINSENEINTQKVNLPGKIEKQYVYDVYEKIASHFSSTRYKPWTKVVEFLETLEEGSQIRTKNYVNFTLKAFVITFYSIFDIKACICTVYIILYRVSW